jgi:hypothetical protein
VIESAIGANHRRLKDRFGALVTRSGGQRLRIALVVGNGLMMSRQVRQSERNRNDANQIPTTMLKKKEDQFVLSKHACIGIPDPQPIRGFLPAAPR